MDRKLVVPVIVWLVFSTAAVAACVASAMVSESAFVDPAGDLFGEDTESCEAYLDIVQVSMLRSQDFSILKIKTSGALPDRTSEPQIFIEWDAWIDFDSDISTGYNWPFMFNDIGPDVLFRVTLKNASYEAQIFWTIPDRYLGNFPYEITADTIEFNLVFPQWVKIEFPTSFSFSAAVRKYGEAGKPLALLVADKAPNEGHFTFPEHKMPISRGLPEESFRSMHATVYYNAGNEMRTKNIAEGFEYAYSHIAQDLPSFSVKNFTLYVYARQEDLVKGLTVYSGISAEEASFFSGSGAPRPIKYVMHASPYFGLHEVTHELTHTFIEEFSGNVYKSIKWLDEGLAEYEAYKWVWKTKCNETELNSKIQRLEAVYALFEQGKLFALEDLSSSDQWGERMVEGFSYEIYSQSYLTVVYLSTKYGLEKCTQILKSMQEGAVQEEAIQSALGISIAQLDVDFKNYLQENEKFKDALKAIREADFKILYAESQGHASERAKTLLAEAKSAFYSEDYISALASATEAMKEAEGAPRPMPSLVERYGTYAVIAVIIAIPLIVLYFRRKRRDSEQAPFIACVQS